MVNVKRIKVKAKNKKDKTVAKIAEQLLNEQEYVWKDPRIIDCMNEFWHHQNIYGFLGQEKEFAEVYVKKLHEVYNQILKEKHDKEFKEKFNKKVLK